MSILKKAFDNSSSIYFDKHGNIIDKADNKHDIADRIDEFLETLEHIKSGHLNHPNEIKQYVSEFLKFYKEITGKDYPNAHQLIQEIEAAASQRL